MLKNGASTSFVVVLLYATLNKIGFCRLCVIIYRQETS